MQTIKIEATDHEHDLYRDGHRHGLELECDACDQTYHDGICCNECKFTVHEQCAFLLGIPKTSKHPSHDGHCVELLTTGAPDQAAATCHICGKNTKRLLYHCSTCNLNMDIDCMVDALCAQAELNVPWHHHPLLMVDFGKAMICNFCRRRWDVGYFCPRCRLMVHESCVFVFDSPEITHPCHVRHPLKLLTTGAPGYTDPECHLCGSNTRNFLYHCKICKLSLDMDCAVRNPPPVSLSSMKVHEHTLTLMPRLISFVCDACGTRGDRAPYVCLQCNFMVHQKCAYLPRIIHINRHDHRVSYTYPLGPGEWTCGVCWEEIDWSCGAYTCSRCPKYAFHSKCATREDVWDGLDLDGVPEKVEDIMPFKVNEDGTITHFAHEHNMRLSKDGFALGESILCGACVRPISCNTFYNCSVCHFVLHETCANLPKKKRHFLSCRPLSLIPNATFPIPCNACLQFCCRGSMYVGGGTVFDLLCTSIEEPFNHGCHPHPLLYLDAYRIGRVRKTCQGCGIDTTRVLGCIKCNFFVDFRCATLPSTVRLERYDDHPLVLCYGDINASGKYWCDICERETNPETWFYTCIDCGVTLHVFCVVGDLRYAKQGAKFGDNVELLPNKSSSRPLCTNCRCRCPGPFFLKDYDSLSLCSLYCFQLKRLLPERFHVICPPWASEPIV